MRLTLSTREKATARPPHAKPPLPGAERNPEHDRDRCGDYDDEGNADHSGHFFMWISTSSNHTVPALGQKVPATIGSRTVPSGTPLAKGVPTAGGSMTSISRGGFGVKAGTTGGYGSKAGS